MKDLLFLPYLSSIPSYEKQVPHSGRAARPAKIGLDALIARPKFGMTIFKFPHHEQCSFDRGSSGCKLQTASCKLYLRHTSYCDVMDVTSGASVIALTALSVLT